MASCTRERSDGGQVLMMVPAGFLILVMLASIAFDFSHLYIGQRELTSVADGIANDLATAGLDPDLFQATKELRLNADRVERFAAELIDPHRDEFDIVFFDAEVMSPTVVRVTIRAELPYVFLKAIPGYSDTQQISASADADALQLRQEP